MMTLGAIAALVHCGFWVLVALAAWFNAGNYSIWNCWPADVLFSPLLLLGFLAFGALVVLSAVYLAMAAFNANALEGGFDWIALHLLILGGGIVLETIAAYAASPDANCNFV